MSRRLLAFVLAALTSALYVAAVYMGVRAQTHDLLGGITWGTAALLLALIGAFITVKRPDNAIGWLLLLYGLFETTAGAASLYGEFGPATGVALPWAVPITWLGSSVWAFSSAILLVFLPLLFPTGHPVTRRWRWVGWVAVAAVCLLLTSTVYIAVFRPQLMAEDWETAVAAASDMSWLFTLSDLGFPLLMTAAPVALLSLIVRFVRSTGIQRQQIKLLAYAAALTVFFIILVNVGDLPRVPEAIASAVAMPSIGVATMVAILRYRLYDIDRIISRTVTYAVLTAVLVALYLVAVTTVTAITAPVAGESPLAVAAATLLAAAAFGPARRAIQRVVDRRFNRARYDAARTVESYRGALREEVDIDALREELVTVVRATVQPAAAAVWLRETT